MLTIRGLQDHSLAVGPNTGGVEGFDSGIVGAVKVKPVDGAQRLLANVHFLKE